LSVPFRYQAGRAPHADEQQGRLVSLNRKSGEEP
jgi:hypothetical protein